MTPFPGVEETKEAFLALEQTLVKFKEAMSATGRLRPSLRELAETHDAAKGSNCSGYEMFLRGFRDQPVKLLEIGIGGDWNNPSSGGGSLRMWREYFQRGQIYAVDVFDKSPHNADRIHVRQGSQDDANFLRSVAAEMAEIDIIIDDGSHFSSHVIKSFETLFPYLKSGGIYIVEDIATSYWPERDGSLDVNDPATSMNYFKRAADGAQWVHSRGVVQCTPITQFLEFVHFGNNFIVMRKL